MRFHDQTVYSLSLAVTGIEHNSTQYLHTLIEAMRVSFADTAWYVADPEKVNVPIKELLSDEYANKRRKLIQPNRYITFQYKLILMHTNNL